MKVTVGILFSVCQWDVLSSGNPVHEIAHIANGVNPGNCTSIIRVNGLFHSFLLSCSFHGNQNHMLLKKLLASFHVDIPGTR